MLTLYGSSQSRSFRALWALEEANIDYNYITINLGKAGDNGAQSDSYKAINYQGKVPSLVNDQFVVTESAAILNYIGALAPNMSLIPEDLKQRAHYDELCFFVLSELEQPLWTTAKHRFALPKQYRIKDIRSVTEFEFEKAITALENIMDEGMYAVSGQFTMADILITHTLRWAKAFNFSISDRLDTYMQNHCERNAFQRAVNKESN